MEEWGDEGVVYGGSHVQAAALAAVGSEALLTLRYPPDS